MKVTTRSGDKGTTYLYAGRQVAKTHPLIELLGLSDELQALIGILKTQLTKKSQQKFLTKLQKQLYLVMAEISGANKVIENELKLWVNDIEAQEHRLLETVRINNKFIVPGENLAEAYCHLVRTKTRALERFLCRVAKSKGAFSKFIPYFNRLSDYFFILGRALI